MTLPTMLPHSRADARVVSGGRRRSVGEPGGAGADHLHQPRLDHRPGCRGRAHRAGPVVDDDRHPPRPRRGGGGEGAGLGRRAVRRPADRGCGCRRARARLPRHRGDVHPPVAADGRAGGAYATRLGRRAALRGRRPGRPPTGAGRVDARDRRGHGPEGDRPRRVLGRRRRRRVDDGRRPRRHGRRVRTDPRRVGGGRPYRGPAPVVEHLVRARRRRGSAAARLRVHVHEDHGRRGRRLGCRFGHLLHARCAARARSTTLATPAPTSSSSCPRPRIPPSSRARGTRLGI